jgi:hypothetical protein
VSRLFFIFISLLYSCTKQAPPIPPEDTHKIDASILKISKVEAKIVSNPKRKVEFKIRKHPTAMHAQFIICTVTKPVRCNPSEKAPGVARTDEYEFLSPPHGDLEIKVRACVDPPYALDPNKHCGPWKRSTVATETYGKGSFIR